MAVIEMPLRVIKKCWRMAINGTFEANTFPEETSYVVGQNIFLVLKTRAFSYIMRTTNAHSRVDLE